MDKKELEARYQHKFPGYKPASDLNNKFRDIEVNPKAFKFNSQTTEDSNTYGIALNAAQIDNNHDQNQKSLLNSQGIRWSQKHWQANNKFDSKDNFMYNTTEPNDGAGVTSIRFAEKNLRIKNIDGNLKQQKLYSTLAKVNPKTDAYFYPNPSFLIHPGKIIKYTDQF